MTVAQRAGIAEIVHLDRRRTARQHDGRGAFRVPLQVDQNVDRIAPDRIGDRHRALMVHVDEAVERRLQARPHRRAVVAPGRVREDLEAIAVVLLEHAGRQERGGVLMEVGGEIADCANARPTACAGAAWARRRRTSSSSSSRIRVVPAVDGSASSAKGDSPALRAATPARKRSTHRSRSRQSAMPPARKTSCDSAGPCVGSMRSTCS